MNCKYCDNIISNAMKFCPYCGSKIGGAKKEAETNIHEQISAWYNNDQYEEIFEEALNGNNIAKCYFIRYISYAKDKPENEQLMKKIKALFDEGNPFALTAMGFRKFCGGQKNLLGYENEDLINQGIELIKKAADLGEVSAATLVADWMTGGKYAEKNISAAYKLMKSAADSGYPSAMYYLGIWHKDSLHGISKNEELGEELIEKAAFFGDQSALRYFKENNEEWFESKLDFAMSEDDIKRTIVLIRSDKPEAQNLKTDLELAYENCKTNEDYIALYKLIRDDHLENDKENGLFESLKLLVANITGYALDKVTFEEAEAAEELAKKIVQLTDKYECPQHYLHFKEDLKALKIDVDEESLPGLLKLVSNIFREKYPNEIDSYVKYAKAKKEDKTVRGNGCVFVGLIIVAIISGIFLPIVGIIVGGLALIVKLGEIITKKEFKKIPQETKDDYLLINALIGYGYTPVDPEVFESEYDTEDIYENKVPSIFDSNDSK